MDSKIGYFFASKVLFIATAPKKTDSQKHQQESAESRSKGKAIEEIKKAKQDARPKQATLPLERGLDYGYVKNFSGSGSEEKT